MIALKRRFFTASWNYLDKFTRLEQLDIFKKGVRSIDVLESEVFNKSMGIYLGPKDPAGKNCLCFAPKNEI
jgi:hypothetical protein